MAVTVEAVDRICTRLRELLLYARQVKAERSVEPPLHQSDFEYQVTRISEAQGQFQPLHDKPHHAYLETAAREIFQVTLAKFSIDDPDFVDIWNLLDIVQFSANHDQCDPCLSLWLIEELLDSQTIDGCRRVFDYLESRREQLITSAPGRNKQLIILRSCNELLRRLSRAEDAVFCGRVFIFLFQSFPLGDKSSVNLRGEFHVENTTTFDPPEPKEEIKDEENGMEVDAESMELTEETKRKDGIQDSKGHVEDKASGESDQNLKPSEEPSKTVTFEAGDKPNQKDDKTEIDMDMLYTNFWTLQHIYSNPPKLFAREQFDSFKRGLELTLEKFKAVPKVMPHDTLAEAEEQMKNPQDDQNDMNGEFASSFNAKYLTNRDLFELELSDVTFQRHILVQALILIEFLLSLTPKSKKKIAELKAQKAMIYNYTLSDEDANWATNMKTQIVNYLREGPDGNFYFRMIDNVLSRDKNWVRWKIESCPPIEMPAIQTERVDEARDWGKRAFNSRKIKETPLGAMDMKFLDDTVEANPFEMLKNPHNYAPPPAEKYVKELQTIELDMEMADPAEKDALKEKRAAATWRALRLASRTNIRAFEKINESDSKTFGILESRSLSEDEAPEKVEEPTDGEERASSVIPEIKVNDESTINNLNEIEKADAVAAGDGEIAEPSVVGMNGEEVAIDEFVPIAEGQLDDEMQQPGAETKNPSSSEADVEPAERNTQSTEDGEQGIHQPSVLPEEGT